MKSIIIYYSYSNMNTEKIVKEIAAVLGADIMHIGSAKPINLEEYDVIGFASGIYYNNFHKSIYKYVEELKSFNNKKSFLVYTSGAHRAGFEKKFKKAIEKKGFIPMATFYEKCMDTFGPFKLIGGINKSKPDEESYRRAREFAHSLLEKYDEKI